MGLAKEDSPVRWTRDGRGLVVFRESEAGARVDVVDLATGNRSPLHAIEPEDRAGLVAIGPVCLTPDGRAYAYNYFRILSDLYVVEGLK